MDFGTHAFLKKYLGTFEEEHPLLLQFDSNPDFMDYVDKLLACMQTSQLFPSPYISGKPLTRHWAYHLVRWLDQIVSEDLHKKLGLPAKKEEKKQTSTSSVASLVPKSAGK